jgi:hypothetical protein
MRDGRGRWQTHDMISERMVDLLNCAVLYVLSTECHGGSFSRCSSDEFGGASGILSALNFKTRNIERYRPEVLAPVLSDPGRVRWKPTHRDVVDTCPILPALVDRYLRILPERLGDIEGAR